MNEGVSLVICCYNSSKLLPETLRHVSQLKNPSSIPFEIIIVDNNSDDDTSEIAKKLLTQYSGTANYKVLYQKVQGLSYARKMGLDNSSYEFVLFCDDDNWLEEDYLEIGFRIMHQNSKIGVLGGESSAITNGNFPGWFEKFQQSYSVGKQSEVTGDITWTYGALWGAGMIVRRSALLELYLNGFKSLLTDRSKDLLTSGGDIELCYALRLAGWEIWYEPSLKLIHYIPQKKLKWEYLRKLSRGFGAQKVNLDPYLKAFQNRPKNSSGNSENNWVLNAAGLLRKLRGYGINRLLKFNSAMEGDPEILRVEKTIGRLNELAKIRGEYGKRINSVRAAGWRKVFSLNNSHSENKNET